MKKMVLKIGIEDEKSKKKILKAIAGVQGVDSVAVDMKEKKMTVIGEVDPVVLTSKLRKFGFSELLSVCPAREVKVGSAKEEKKEGEKSHSEAKNTGEVPQCVPSVGMVMIGGAVHGAESILNENLFVDANIGVDRVTEIGTHETHCVWSELSTIIECYVVTSDSSEEDINIPLTNFPFNKVCEGQWIITLIVCNALRFYFHCQIQDVLRRYRIMKEFRVEMKRGEPWKCVGVLRTIVDRLHHL